MYVLQTVYNFFKPKPRQIFKLSTPVQRDIISVVVKCTENTFRKLVYKTIT